jgi:hypothetical protein
MGAGITALAAQQGTVVRLKDSDLPKVGKGLRAVSDQLRERLKRRQITRREFEDELALVGGTVEYSGFGNVDLVIEAVFEDLEVKHQVLREAAEAMPGAASYAITQQELMITLGLTYRLHLPTKLIRPYASLGPRLFLMHTSRRRCRWQSVRRQQRDRNTARLVRRWAPNTEPRARVDRVVDDLGPLGTSCDTSAGALGIGVGYRLFL